MNGNIQAVASHHYTVIYHHIATEDINRQDIDISTENTAFEVLEQEVFVLLYLGPEGAECN